MHYLLKTASAAALFLLLSSTSVHANKSHENFINLPLRREKATKKTSPRPRLGQPTWENKLFSALEGVQSYMHGLLGASTADVSYDIINDENWKYMATIYVGSDK